jgi:tetratricopeptide (TPR) repeat protein
LRLRSVTYLALLLLLVLFQSCGTKKNTFIHRGYHNMTARFNGYYWSSEAIKEGVFKIEGNHKDNYEKLLPVYIVPSNEAAKATFPDFDKAIKKSSLVIQRHTIKDKKDNEIPTAGKWIDNNWINIGISRIYKREFFSGIEALDYVVRTYKTKDKYKALLWQAKALNEIGSVSQSDPIIGLLNNDKKLPKKIKSQMGAIRGDYFIKRGLYKEAIGALTEAANQKGILRKGLRKKERARYAFIVAQLYEEEKDIKKARQFYEKALSLKPAYDMVFYANIKLARLVDTKRGNAEKTKTKLLKMTKDSKNSDYLDVIYFTLGEIEEKERHEDKAIAYYKKSAANSVSNLNQKALAYLKLGDIYFEKSNYQLSEGYYDSTIVVLPKDHPNYNNIVNRKNTLSTLVGYIRTIQREDSLQKLARLSEAERNKAIDNIIEKLEYDEERRREELENLKSQNQNPLTNNPATNPGDNIFGGSGGWYFYNQTTISFGIADFAKRWGNRKLEDNWRRSAKGLSIENNDTNNETVATKTATAGNGKNNTKNKDPRRTREYYLKQIPLTDTLMKTSHSKIIEADYLLGTTYKEELNNNKRSIAAFEDLNNRYPEHKYRLQCYYQLYRTYLADKNQPQSDVYKDKLLSEYPKSEYAKLIKNPKYAEELNAQRGEVEKFYESTFDLYSAGNYEQSYAQCNEALKKFGKTDFSAKFELVRVMCVGRLKGPDSLTWALNEFLILYPNSEVTPRANEIFNALKKYRNPALVADQNSANKPPADTFAVSLDKEHFALIISADDPKITNPYKSSIDNFNREYYSNKNFSIASNLFGTGQQMILVKSFSDASEAYKYIGNLQTDTKLYTGNIKKEAFSFFIISAENLPHFYKKASASYYKAFFDEAYKTVIQEPK